MPPYYGAPQYGPPSDPVPMLMAICLVVMIVSIWLASVFEAQGKRNNAESWRGVSSIFMIAGGFLGGYYLLRVVRGY